MIKIKPQSVNVKFTQVPNHIWRDKDLSFGAKGLVTYLLTHRDGYDLTQKQIMSDLAIGLRLFKAARNELVAKGMLTVTLTKGHGKFEPYLYELEDLFDENSWIINVSTSATFVIVDESAVANDTHKNTKDLKNTNSKNYSLEFEDFWKTYPRRDRNEYKPDAFKEYNRVLKQTSHELLMTCAKNYALAEGSNEYRYSCHNWLKKEQWKNYQATQSVVANNGYRSKEL